MKHLHLLDPKTGEQTDLGTIARSKCVGTNDAWLTYDETNAIWWIVVRSQSGGFEQFGYNEPRREVCWQTFMDLDEQHIAWLRADGAQRKPS